MKARKGDYGYVRSQKQKRLLVTLGLFLLPLAVFVLGLVLTKGNRNNIFTVVAVVGCLPGCKSAVGLFMMMIQKPVEETVYRRIAEHAGQVLMCYELYITKETGSLMLEACGICGEEVVCYTSRSSSRQQRDDVTAHVRKLLRANGYRCHVRILDDLDAFERELADLNARRDALEEAANANFTPDERYPDLSRDELVKHNLLALAL